MAGRSPASAAGKGSRLNGGGSAARGARGQRCQGTTTATFAQGPASGADDMRTGRVGRHELRDQARVALAGIKLVAERDAHPSGSDAARP